MYGNLPCEASNLRFDRIRSLSRGSQRLSNESLVTMAVSIAGSSCIPGFPVEKAIDTKAHNLWALL